MSVLSNAILLIGPTGAGKTPLGAYLERHGLGSRRCHHFDFGDHLRKAAGEPGIYPRLSKEDRGTIAQVLLTGALLEDDQFYIAKALMRSFAENRAFHRDDLLVLNGLPRHVGQASAVDEIVEVVRVVYLECAVERVYQRILTNSGGDRAGRTDDSPEHVARKIALFERRTRPLLDHYRKRRVPIIKLEIEALTTPKGIACALL